MPLAISIPLPGAVSFTECAIACGSSARASIGIGAERNSFGASFINAIGRSGLNLIGSKLFPFLWLNANTVFFPLIGVLPFSSRG